MKTATRRALVHLFAELPSSSDRPDGTLCPVIIVQTMHHCACRKFLPSDSKIYPLNSPIRANSSQFEFAAPHVRFRPRSHIGHIHLHVFLLFSATAVTRTHPLSRSLVERADRIWFGQHWRAKLEGQNAANKQSTALFRTSIPVPLSPHLPRFQT